MLRNTETHDTFQASIELCHDMTLLYIDWKVDSLTVISSDIGTCLPSSGGNIDVQEDTGEAAVPDVN